MGGIYPGSQTDAVADGFLQTGRIGRSLLEPDDTVRIEYDAAPRSGLNASRFNRDGIVTEQGLVFTDFGGVFGLYQLGLNTLFHRLRYWKIRVL